MIATPRSLRHRLTSEVRTEIVAQYEAGVPSTQLVREYGLGKGTILKVLREGGVKMRNQSLTEQQIAKAEQLYGSGLSLARIGERSGVDSTTVHRALVRRGVRMRDTHGRER